MVKSYDSPLIFLTYVFRVHCHWLINLSVDGSNFVQLIFAYLLAFDTCKENIRFFLQLIIMLALLS